MYKNKFYSSRSSCDFTNHCNNIANQYIILVSIFAAIISQEIEDDEALGILGSFLISLGEEVALASEVRIACKAKLDEDTNISEESEDVFVRSIGKPRKIRKIKRNKK